MNEEVESFYGCLKDLYADIVRKRTKTISTEEFKNRATSIYETWKIKVKPLLVSIEIDLNVLDGLDNLIEATYAAATLRTVSEVSNLRNTLGELHDMFLNKIIVPLNSEQKAEPTAKVMEYASFLGLDTNWSVAVCALQLQEVAVTLVAEKLKIDLGKTNVEQILKAKIAKDFSFNHQYEAFRIEVKRQFDVDMPFLTTQFRRMRVKVLHEGYNPEPEEKDSLTSFTIGLLKKLDSICSAEKV
jgi:hypothetical protein